MLFKLTTLSITSLKSSPDESIYEEKEDSEEEFEKEVYSTLKIMYLNKVLFQFESHKTDHLPDFECPYCQQVVRDLDDHCYNNHAHAAAQIN